MAVVTNATHTTPNYGLPQFIATDKPAWLVDWNNTMAEIDTQLKAISDAGDNTEILEIIGDENSGLIKSINDLQTLTAEHTSDISSINGTIQTIQGQITNIQADLTTQNGLIQGLDRRVTDLENA